MTVNRITVDRITVGRMAVDRMTNDRMTLGRMKLSRMTMMRMTLRRMRFCGIANKPLHLIWLCHCVQSYIHSKDKRYLKYMLLA